MMTMRAALEAARRSQLLAPRGARAESTTLPADFQMLLPFARTPKNGPEAPVKPPRCESTTLPSGLRVVSQETYTHMSALGVVVEAGSAHEWLTLGTSGGAHLNELMAWRATHRRSQAELLQDVERIGGFLHANAQREQSLYCIDVLRESAGKAMELLAETVLLPRLDAQEVEDALLHMRMSFEDSPPAMKVREMVHAAAYGRDSALGSPLLSTPEDHLKTPLDGSTTLMNFRSKLLTPRRTVVAGAGIQHADLVAYAEEHFEPHWAPPAASSSPDDDEAIATPDSEYVGGSATVVEEPLLPGGAPDPRNLVHLTLCYEAGGWHSADLVPLCVLQTLLGGGSSFSAGGPGKGMYSRLYREVLNGNYWVESAEAFVSIHSNGGLFGVSGACPPDKIDRLTQIFTLQLVRLAYEDVSPVELDRAKNMLKINVMTQLESRLMLFEDMVRQFSTYGKRQTMDDLRAQIEAVDAKAIRTIGQRFLRKGPSIAAHGADLAALPNVKTIAAWYA